MTISSTACMSQIRSVKLMPICFPFVATTVPLYAFGTMLGRRRSAKNFAFSVRQKGATVPSHAHATDGPICSSTTDGPSSVSSVSKFPVAPLCGFADQDMQVLRMLTSEVNGMDLNFTHLTNCTVYICGCPCTVHISGIAQ